jgi:hypothetical protein
VQEMEAPKKHGKVISWVARKPKQAFWVVGVASMFIGFGIGAGSGSDQAAADKANAAATSAQGRLASLRGELTKVKSERDTLAGRLESSQSRAETAEAAVKKLSAKAEVPDLTGMDYADARDNETVSQVGWKIRSTTRVSSRAPGTVISQSPREGKVLKAGRSITLVVARKAPPKPKQWVTIKTLTGDSATKTDEFSVPSGYKARLKYSMPQDSNNAITLYKAPDEYEDLLLNEIGPQSGTTRLYSKGTFYLDVMGAFNIEVQVFKRPA